MWLKSVLFWLLGAPSAPFLCLLGCPMILKPPSTVCGTRSPSFILELSFFILVICESVMPFDGEYFKIKQSLSVRCTHCSWWVLVLSSFQWSELGRTCTCAVPDFWGCQNKSSQTGGLKTIERYYLTVLDAKSPKSRCQQGSAPSEAGRGLLVVSAVSGVASRSWLQLHGSRLHLCWPVAFSHVPLPSSVRK